MHTERQILRSLLHETQAEIQVNKAILFEYEQISKTIQEFQFNSQQIRKESQEILQMHRKSLLGLEENKNGVKLINNMISEEEIKRLDRLSKKLNGL